MAGGVRRLLYTLEAPRLWSCRQRTTQDNGPQPRPRRSLQLREHLLDKHWQTCFQSLQTSQLCGDDLSFFSFFSFFFSSVCQIILIGYAVDTVIFKHKLISGMCLEYPSDFYGYILGCPAWSTCHFVCTFLFSTFFRTYAVVTPLARLLLASYNFTSEYVTFYYYYWYWVTYIKKCCITYFFKAGYERPPANPKSEHPCEP
jgi:hypothetical protein